MDEIDEIIAGLNETQLRIIRRHRPDYGDPREGWPGSARLDKHSFAQCGRPLMDARLITWASKRDSHTVLTTLGQQVQARLSPHRPARGE